MDLAAVFLLSLLGGYFFVYTWRLTAYSTQRVEGHHLYFRAAFCGVIFFAIALLLRRLLLENATYAHIDADIIKYVTPVLKDDSSTPHPVDQEHRAEWVVTEAIESRMLLEGEEFQKRLWPEARDSFSAYSGIP